MDTDGRSSQKTGKKTTKNLTKQQKSFTGGKWMQKPIRAFLAASEAMPKEAEMPVCSVCVCPAVLWI